MSTTRGRLGRLLEEREQTTGLAPTPGERREDEALELAARAAEAEFVQEPDSLEAIEADALQRVGDLKAQIERMAVEALTDGKVATEQKAAESELAEAQRALENVARARREISRRETEAAEQAAEEDRVLAERQVAELTPQILKAAERVDTVAGTFGEAVAAFKDLRNQQSAALARTARGNEAVRSRSYRAEEITVALAVALRERGLKIPGVEARNHAGPLAAGEGSEI
jgi:hypothetical protein